MNLPINDPETIRRKLIIEIPDPNDPFWKEILAKIRGESCGKCGCTCKKVTPAPEPNGVEELVAHFSVVTEDSERIELYRFTATKKDWNMTDLRSRVSAYESHLAEKYGVAPENVHFDFLTKEKHLESMCSARFGIPSAGVEHFFICNPAYTMGMAFGTPIKYSDKPFKV